MTFALTDTLDDVPDARDVAGPGDAFETHARHLARVALGELDRLKLVLLAPDSSVGSARSPSRSIRSSV